MTTSNELFRLIAAALKLPLSAIDLTTSMQTTEAWDSLAHMELIISLEEHYRIMLEADQIAEMTSVAAVVDQLRQRGLLDDEA
ncbi:MAG TPA: acyl carrier protein [Accumulibacter sp.]|uniref:acyl carrier protein n=1 Tax=Accumulibacter sp. TaxID=2053492 RepID=UPI0026124124|nr:acyl carrier protein [Accumulibacter sp.]MDS4015025.1 acyl carrier protein [Accumulibacter sp.]HMV04162.1 acyl carrier protein [Accumulibacter sp.]HMW62848.1 acyl carrier protein [Accumulibacter sp.]HMW78946.1 acyl carrier protein [Accumulibacter sp.]HMX69113.1 acyl carrier protein [Accumulibacter sp.]